jgi:hypothetical protein
MSGGHFDYTQYHTAETFCGQWEDQEINELFRDLFGNEWCDDKDSLVHALDWWQSGDWREEDYRDCVRKFKAKWFGRTDEKSQEFYADKLREVCETYVQEMRREDG